MTHVSLLCCLIAFSLHQPSSAVLLRRAGDSDMETDVSAGSESALPVARGRYLYLCQGANLPPDWLRHVASRPDTTAMFLSYAQQPASSSAGAIHLLYDSETTWTTGRNTLYAMARKVESSQGWRHEYMIFADEDAGLGHPTMDPYTVFHASLHNVQPAVGAVGLPQLPRNGCEIAPCGADIDGVLNAFHATAAPMFLPYDPTFDEHSWWDSQAILIEMLMATAPEYVVQFNQVHIVSEPGKSDYPRNETNFRRQEPGKQSRIAEYLRKKVHPCLRESIGLYEIATEFGSGCHRCPLAKACSTENPRCIAGIDNPFRDYEQLLSCKPKPFVL